MKTRMKMPKIIFIDLDRTTLDKKKNGHWRISQENALAIEKYRNKGIEIVVSTGRGPNETTFEILEKINSRSNWIGWNGSVIFQNNQKIFAKNINSILVDKLMTYAKDNNVTAVVNSDFKNNSYSNSLAYKIGLFVKGYRSKKHADFINNFPIAKLIFWTLSRKKIKKVFNDLKTKFDSEITIAFSGANNSYIEITPLGCTKGLANKFYAESKKIALDDCMHIGDSMNDATTTNYFKNVIGMKNSSKDFKKLISIVSPYSYKNGGLAKTLDYYFGELIEN